MSGKEEDAPIAEIGGDLNNTPFNRGAEESLPNGRYSSFAMKHHI
jgi:hypothetical protein